LEKEWGINKKEMSRKKLNTLIVESDTDDKLVF
jgi:hypothetical protein